MRILRVLPVLLLVSIAAAQLPTAETKEEKEKRLQEQNEKVVAVLDQAAADAQALKLAHNRAVVYALVGDLFWQFDEKRAREIFRNCESEIISANVDFERDSRWDDDPLSRVYEFSSLRNEVLPLVAKHDAALALEMLLRTRPASVANAIARVGDPNAKSDADVFTFTPERQAVRTELELEQRFAFLAADSDPDKAIALIKESLAKGISNSVLPLLDKLNRIDPKKAGDLAGDVIRKVLDTDLTKKPDDLNAAIGFLAYGIRTATSAKVNEKQFKFTDAQLKDLANKLASTFLLPSRSTGLVSSMSRAMPYLEKLVPERVALLKARQAEMSKNLPSEYKRAQERQKLWNDSTTPEQILAMLPKLNQLDRASAYQVLPTKISAIEDETRARKLIDQIPDDGARERAANQFESAKVGRAAREGKFDEAHRMIANLGNRKMQVQRLVALALDFQRRPGEKNKENAAGLMKEARALINEFPEDEDELNNLLEVVKGYSLVEPAEGFRIFEPVIDQINEVVQASAVLSKYNKRNRSFKNGELVLRAGGYSGDGVILFRCVLQMQMLGKADFERMNQLADRLQRPDSRVIAKLYIAQGFLRGTDRPIPPFMAGITVF